MNEEARIITSKSTQEDQAFELSVRPKQLKDYIGQETVKRKMKIFLTAALKRKEALDHSLIFGPPGLGKTTLAHIIAKELNVNFRQTSGPVLARPGDLVAILTSLEPNDVLFVDEIHRLSLAVEESLYPAMEDFKLDIMIGEGAVARPIRLDVPPFTLVGATTRAGLLTSPLRDRFGIVERLEFYGTGDLAKIIKRTAKILKLDIDDGGAKKIAGGARGTPRVANRLLRRARDYAEVEGDGRINAKVASAAMDLLEVDKHGFDNMDRMLLGTLIKKFEGGPVGIGNLAAAIGEERDTLEDVVEPFLIQEGFLQRTARGRVATRLAYEHFGLSVPAHPEQKEAPLGKDEQDVG